MSAFRTLNLTFCYYVMLTTSLMKCKHGLYLSLMTSSCPLPPYRINTPRKQGGLGPMNIPLVADLTQSISRDYGVLKEDQGIAYRSVIYDTAVSSVYVKPLYTRCHLKCTFTFK